jgi:predicted transcriptional regulator
MEVANMTPNDFLKIIQQETMPLDEIPDGWHSTEELCKTWNLSKSTVQEKIKAGKELGYITEKRFLIKKNVARRVNYYKFHEKENNQKINKREDMENTNRSRRKDKRS